MTGTLSKLDFKAGFFKDDTPLASEGGWIDGYGVRFVRGRPQIKGGNEVLSPGSIGAPARGGHAWITLEGIKAAAFGSATNLWVVLSGSRRDITPSHSEGVLTNPFTVKSGSAIVSVAHANHAFVKDQTVTYSHAVAVGGLTLNGTYAVTPISGDSYTITAGTNATSNATGGGTVDYVSVIPAGRVDGSGGLGYSSGKFSVGYYSIPSATDYQPRVWSFGNIGETLYASYSGGGLYEYQPEVQYPELLTNTALTSATGWATGTGWSIAGGSATKSAGTASNLSQSVKTVLEGGRVYRVTFTVSGMSAGTLAFKINAGSPTPALIDLGNASIPITQNGTYTRLFRCPATPSDAVWVADAAFNGSVSAPSIKLEGKAYRIDTAPYIMNSMFVDPGGFIVAVGTEEFDGDYNPLLIRWSDQANAASWAPGTSSLAGEQPLAVGGRAIAGIVTRQQNLVFTDAAAYAMQFATTGFDLRLLGSGCGLYATHAACEQNGRVMWMSNSGNFHISEGSTVQVIDCPVRADVMTHIAKNQAEKVYASVHPEFNEAIWFYPDSRYGSECNRSVTFDYVENEWVTDTQAITTWIPSGIYPSPIGITADGMVRYFEQSKGNNGGDLAWSLMSAFCDIEDGNNLVDLMGYYPDFQALEGMVYLRVHVRNSTTGPVRSVGPFTITPATEKVDFRITGRQFAFEFYGAAQPMAGRFGVLRFFVRKSGSLR